MPALAIDGGVPVRRKMLSCGHQWLDEAAPVAFTDVLRSDWLVPEQFHTMIDQQGEDARSP
jgi:hypothetical protein